MTPINLLIKTYPFLLLRFFLGVLLLYAGYRCFVWGMSLTELFGLDMLVTDLLFGYIGLSFFILYIDITRKLLLHFIGYSHVAGMTFALEGKKIGVIKSARIMLGRFGSVSAMYFVDGLMKKVVRQVSEWILEKGNFIPSMFKKGFLSKIVASTLNNIVFSLLEVIISYLYKNKDMKFWDGAIKGTSLYVQSWKHILKSAFLNSLWLKLFSWILSILVMGVSIWSLWGAGITAIISTFIFYKILTALAKMTFVDPYQTASMLVGFYQGIENKTPDESVATLLSDISDNFKDLVMRGKEEGSELATRVTSLLGDKLSTAEEDSLMGSKNPLNIIAKEIGANEKNV